MRIPLAALLLPLLAACGGPTTATDPPLPTASEPTATTTAGPDRGEGSGQPPPFRVRYDGTELVLHAHTYCYDTGCVDGVVEDPHDVGSPEEVLVHVPVEGFDLEVGFTDHATAGESGCDGRSFPVPAEELGDGWYRISPHGPAGDYRVELFASGGGDMIAGLRWHPPTNGEMPTPSAQLALIADHDGEPDSYGLEFSVSDLARTPEEASAVIEVTAANGRSMTIRPKRKRDGCTPEGLLRFGAPESETDAAARLGDFPFTTEVTLTLDGTTYTATATYPDDEIEGNEPNVALTFEPPLPALS